MGEGSVIDPMSGLRGDMIVTADGMEQLTGLLAEFAQTGAQVQTYSNLCCEMAECTNFDYCPETGAGYLYRQVTLPVIPSSPTIKDVNCPSAQTYVKSSAP